MATCLIEMTSGYVLRCGRGRGNLHFNAGDRYRVTVEDAVHCIEAKVAKPADDNGELAELYAYVHAPEPEPEPPLDLVGDMAYEQAKIEKANAQQHATDDAPSGEGADA